MLGFAKTDTPLAGLQASDVLVIADHALTDTEVAAASRASAIVVIGPLFLIPLWAVTIPVMMVERTDVGGAFNRSMDLTAGRRLPIMFRPFPVAFSDRDQ